MRRKLPECCYDFRAMDARDGELGSVRATLKEAQADALAWRARLTWASRCVISVVWTLNEAKILAWAKKEHDIDAMAARRCAEERARIVEFIRSTPDHTTRILAMIADEIEAGLHEEMTGPLSGRAERARAAALARKACEP